MYIVVVEETYHVDRELGSSFGQPAKLFTTGPTPPGLPLSQLHHAAAYPQKASGERRQGDSQSSVRLSPGARETARRAGGANRLRRGRRSCPRQPNPIRLPGQHESSLRDAHTVGGWRSV